MESLDVLLSPEFKAFSEFCAEAASKKAELKKTLEEHYRAITATIKGIDANVLATQEQFEEWKKERATVADS